MRTLRPQRPMPRETHARAFFIPARRAFTLVELVLVLAIMGVIAAIAAPRYGAAISRQRADGAASRIASDIAYARALARSTSASVTITFDPSHNRYGIPSASNPITGASPYLVTLGDSPYHVTLLGGAAGSVSALTPSTGSRTGTFSFTFDGFGEASAAGWVVITSGDWTRRISLDSSARTTTITLSESQARVLLP